MHESGSLRTVAAGEGRRRMVLCAALGAALLVACADRPKAVAVAPPSPAPALDAGASDPLSEKLRHCPATVEGATTEVSDTEAGVELVIRAPTASREELMRRTHHLEAFTRNKGKGTGVPHGGGHGGGWMRDCPIVTKDTLVEATETTDGARIRVALSGAGEVDDLRTETRRRLAALRARQSTSP